jgi:alkanesulfonate monooxygenase SsuD/methylene tetrahydromethanopterin reductase-like flavin-dependent oxidoreductase (luciferase family)
MKIGIGVPNQVREVSPAIIPAWAARSEEAGFSSLGTVGRVTYPGVMDTVALAAAAGATSRIKLISNVLIGVVWPPVLLAKEAAGIDGVSGGRLTLGLGLGGRADDFVVEGAGPRGLGRRFDHDLQVYRDVWRGQPVGGGTNPAVPAGTREVPMLFGGFAPAAFARMARWGEGYISASVPASMAAGTFDAARSAWKEAGREGSPRLVAIAYYAFGDIDRGRGNVRDYYLPGGEEMAANTAAGVHGGAEAVKEAVQAFADLGADELIFNPTLDDIDEVARLADAVL